MSHGLFHFPTCFIYLREWKETFVICWIMLKERQVAVAAKEFQESDLEEWMYVDSDLPVVYQLISGESVNMILNLI